LPSEDHVMTEGGMDGEMGHDSEHGETGGDHADVDSGHYHVYFNTDDDSADHVTAWDPTLAFQLPVDVAPGTYEIRINLRAPDHHPIDVQDSIWITVQ
jgi:hypothetical protein